MGVVYRDQGDLDEALEYTMKALRIFISIGAALYADKAHGNLQKIMERMEAAGMEISEGDREEIAELTEKYEKLKGEKVEAATSGSE